MTRTSKKKTLDECVAEIFATEKPLVSILNENATEKEKEAAEMAKKLWRLHKTRFKKGGLSLKTKEELVAKFNYEKVHDAQYIRVYKDSDDKNLNSKNVNNN